LQEETFKTFDGINYALAGPKKMDELIALIANAFRLKPEHDRLFIDCTNAFNQVDRAEAARAIIAKCPRLARYYYFLYQEDTNIWIRENDDQWTTISGSQGGIQGCVLAPIVYGYGSLTPYTNVKAILDTKENSIFGAFLDDSVISAAHQDTVEAFDSYKKDGPEYGLHINCDENKTVVLLGKCEDDAETQRRITAYSARGIPLANIKMHPDNGGPEEDYGYIHLGVPVGSETYQLNHLNSLVDKFIEACECDEIVEEAQSKWVYLLYVIRQKFPFWFRHMNPEITSTVEEKIEKHMRNKFETVAGQKISDREWAKACLPTKTHGCGLGKPKDIIAAAFAANVEETMKTVQRLLPGTKDDLQMIHASNEDFASHDFVNDATMHFVREAREKKQIITDAATGLDELPLLTAHDAKEDKKKTQHFFSDIVNRYRAKNFGELVRDHADAIEKAKYLSSDGSFAGAWLFSIPKDTPSTMSNSEFRAALKFRLGIQFTTLLPRCCCPSQTKICNHGRHLFSCNEFKNLLLMRHDALQYDLKQLGTHGGINVVDSGLGQMIERDGRRADLVFKGMGRGGQDLAVDISIGDSSAQSYLHNSAHISKYVLNLLATNKITKYAADYRNAGIDFMPLTFEMLGETSDLFIKFLKKLVVCAADVNNIHYSIMFAYWQKRLSTTLQRYNAKILYMAQNKITRVTNLVRNGDVDLNDMIANERHTHGGA
jgi:hypothetical protein